MDYEDILFQCIKTEDNLPIGKSIWSKVVKKNK